MPAPWSIWESWNHQKGPQLVGVLETFVIFPYIICCSNYPNWGTHIFQRGFSTTSQPNMAPCFFPLKPQDDVRLHAVRLGYEVFSHGTWDIIQIQKERLVGGDRNMTFILFFHSVGNFIIPIDFHMFQRSWNHQPAVPSQRILSHWEFVWLNP